MPFAIAPDGIKLYYDTFGSGDPLLLIMGQGRDHHGWDLIRSDFAKKYRVVVYDHRGTGKSDKPRKPPYSTRDFAQDAVAILDHLDIQAAHVFGISMGGRICQWIAIDNPCRVVTAVLGCTSPGNKHGVRRSSETEALFFSGDWDQKVNYFVSSGWIRSNADTYTRWKNIANREIPIHAQKLHFQASENHNAWDRLKDISAPTLILHGNEDKINPTKNAYLLAKRIPNIELKIIKGGRHEFIIEFREEVVRIVLNFLERHKINRK
jgi:3-oxoadipate enol-lactonase